MLCRYDRQALKRRTEEGSPTCRCAASAPAPWGSSRNPVFIPSRSTAALVPAARDDLDRAGELLAEESVLAGKADARVALGISTRTSGVIDQDAARL